MASMEWVTFDNGGQLPSLRQGHTLTRFLDSPFCVLFGGEEDDCSLLNDMHLFDLHTKTWERVTYQSEECPKPRTLHTATAISSTSLVIIGGTTSNNIDVNLQANNPIETWLFDLRSCVWKQLGIDDSHAPPTRSGHSAVLIRTAGQVPGIYIFGGFGPRSDSATVHRLRLTDWRWEAVSVAVDIPGRPSVFLTDPLTAKQYAKASNGQDETMTEEVCPLSRENHCAVWVPGLDGMVIFGGESDSNVHGDFWLFSPLKGRSNTYWTWRQLNIRMGGGFVDNGIPPISGSACVRFPTDRPVIALWGGVDFNGNIVNGCHVHVVDLLALQSVRVSVKNAPSWGRVLFAIDRHHDKLLVSGGYGQNVMQPATIQCIKLGDMWKANRTSASEFGPVAARIARGEPVDESVERASQSDDDLESMGRLEPLKGPSSISVGTKFNGKVIASEEYGTKVSVIIEGRIHKGYLVAFPITLGKDGMKVEKQVEAVEVTTDTAAVESNPIDAAGQDKKDKIAEDEVTQNVSGEQKQDEQDGDVQKKEGSDEDKSKDTGGETLKRRKREDLEALPEEGTVKRRVAPITKGEVITID